MCFRPFKFRLVLLNRCLTDGMSAAHESAQLRRVVVVGDGAGVRGDPHLPLEGLQDPRPPVDPHGHVEGRQVANVKRLERLTIFILEIVTWVALWTT